jgi:hypothetical protein
MTRAATGQPSLRCRSSLLCASAVHVWPVRYQPPLTTRRIAERPDDTEVNVMLGVDTRLTVNAWSWFAAAHFDNLRRSRAPSEPA